MSTTNDTPQTSDEAIELDDSQLEDVAGGADGESCPPADDPWWNENGTGG